MHKTSSNNHMFHHQNVGNAYGSSPRDLLTNQAVANASPMNNSFTPLNVQRITHSAGSSEDAVVMVKLTDEMFAALEECQKSGKKIRIMVDEHGGTIELGDGTASSINNNTFRFQKQNLSDSTDTLVQTGGNVRNVGTYKTKYQIQATDKSFEETRKRAEKRAEVEKSRGTKEMKKNIPTSSRFSGTSSSTPRSLNSSSFGGSSQSSRISPSFVGTKASTSQLPINKGTPNGAGGASSKAEMLKPKLMRESIKRRVIHLIVTQKYKNWEEVYKKLQSDGLPEDKDIPVKNIQEIVRDVSEMTPTSVNLSLRPNFLAEVDPRWIFFNQEEKAMVRKLQTAGAKGDSSFAPMRKKGMERMTASSRMTDKEKEKNGLSTGGVDTKTSTPEKIPTPPSADVINQASKRSERMDTDDEVYNMPPQGVKRKAHAPPSQTLINGRNTPVIENLAQMEKRARRHDSSSPPEDPMTNISTAAHQIHSKISSTTSGVIHSLPRPDSRSVGGANGGGSTASSRISSPASSLSSPSQPSCDWEKQFGEIKKLSDAETYFDLFHKEYPIYMECYKKLTEVSKEFRRLDGKLQSANSRKNNSSSQAALTMAAKDVMSIERDIQNRYMSYEKDPEFLRARQRHTDLRSKLGVLKSRITNWEQRQSSV